VTGRRIGSEALLPGLTRGTVHDVAHAKCDREPADVGGSWNGASPEHWLRE